MSRTLISFQAAQNILLPFETVNEKSDHQGLRIARESLLEVRGVIHGVQVSAPFGNVKYALEVFSVLEGFGLPAAATPATPS